MFCDGKCENKGKRCGLFTQITMQNGSEVKTFDICTFKAILESQLRIEQGNIRVQAAVESARNEKAKADHEINKTIALGFSGIIDTMNNNSESRTMLEKFSGKIIQIGENHDDLKHVQHSNRLAGNIRP